MSEIPLDHAYFDSNTCGPVLANPTEDMELRAKAYEARCAEKAQGRQHNVLPFRANPWNGMLRLMFPVQVCPEYRAAVASWIKHGSGEMPDP